MTKNQIANLPKAIQMLKRNDVVEQITVATPATVKKYLTPDRLARVAYTEIRKNPKLAECDPKSFVGAMIQSTQLGFEPDSLLGQAYLVPFNSKSGYQCQLIIGYRGMVDIARRSGQVEQIHVRHVYADDVFNYEYGTNPFVEHIPNKGRTHQSDEDIKFVYAVAKLTNGGTQFEVMNRDEIEHMRSYSKAATNGPWVSHWGEMAKKTVFRRLFKMLPVSIDMQRAVGLDELGDIGAQNNAAIIEGEYTSGETEKGKYQTLNKPPPNRSNGKSNSKLNIQV